MPFIRGIETALPPHCIEQSQARLFAAGFFHDLPGIDRLLPVFDHAGIDRRYFSCPTEWFLQHWSFAEKTQVHLEAATELGTRVADQLLASTGQEATSIDAVFVVNSTGIATPSLDARLLFRLGLRPDVRRIPIWGLGCAGGVAGLGHAAAYLEGRPQDRVLLVALELCGVTFLAGDRSRSNLVACALFGEGAAAVLIDGDARAGLPQRGIGVVSEPPGFDTRGAATGTNGGDGRAPSNGSPGNHARPENGVRPGKSARSGNSVRSGNSARFGHDSDWDRDGHDRAMRSRVRFVAAGSTHYPDSLDVMGWHVVDEGLQVVFAQRIPDIVRREARTHFQGFLAKQERTLDDVDHFLFHPGGVKVLQAYSDVLAVDPSRLDRSRAVLRSYGNMSSVTVLFVLAEHLAAHAMTASDELSTEAGKSARHHGLRSALRNAEREEAKARAATGVVPTGVVSTGVVSTGVVPVDVASTGAPVSTGSPAPPRWSGEAIAEAGQGLALLSALGPGFSSESLLLEIS